MFGPFWRDSVANKRFYCKFSPEKMVWILEMANETEYFQCTVSPYGLQCKPLSWLRLNFGIFLTTKSYLHKKKFINIWRDFAQLKVN